MLLRRTVIVVILIPFIFILETDNTQRLAGNGYGEFMYMVNKTQQVYKRDSFPSSDEAQFFERQYRKLIEHASTTTLPKDYGKISAVTSRKAELKNVEDDLKVLQYSKNRLSLILGAESLVLNATENRRTRKIQAYVKYLHNKIDLTLQSDPQLWNIIHVTNAQIGNPHRGIAVVWTFQAQASDVNFDHQFLKADCQFNIPSKLASTEGTSRLHRTVLFELIIQHQQQVKAKVLSAVRAKRKKSAGKIEGNYTVCCIKVACAPSHPIISQHTIYDRTQMYSIGLGRMELSQNSSMFGDTCVVQLSLTRRRQLERIKLSKFILIIRDSSVGEKPRHRRYYHRRRLNGRNGLKSPNGENGRKIFDGESSKNFDRVLLTSLLQRRSRHRRLRVDVLVSVDDDCRNTNFSNSFRNDSVKMLPIRIKDGQNFKSNNSRFGADVNLCNSSRDQYRHSVENLVVNSDNVTASCQLGRTDMSFARIRWSDTIVYPEGFSPNICQGSCRSDLISDTSVSIDRLSNFAFLRALYGQLSQLPEADYSDLTKSLTERDDSICGRSTNQDLSNRMVDAQVRHCVPSSFKPLPVVMQSHRNSYVISVIPDMIIGGCMCV